jgi:hypothetical protein
MCVITRQRKYGFCSRLYELSIAHALSFRSYIWLKLRVREFILHIDDKFVCMNNHGCRRYFEMSSIPSLIFSSSLSTAEPAAGVSTGVASRFATEILQPGQPGSLPSLSTCQVSIRASIYYVFCYIYLQMLLVLQIFSS